MIKRTLKYLLLWSKVSPLLFRLLGKEVHHKLSMYLYLGYWPQIENPRTYNEKILHRKLKTSNPEFRKVEDKWLVREIVKQKIGDEYLPEIYYQTKNPSTIPFDELPEEYVIKPNHLADGKNIIVTDSKEVDQQAVIHRCHEWLNSRINPLLCEYWTQEIEPRILIEEYIEEPGFEAPVDYKFFCFNGEVKFIHVTLNRKDDIPTTRNFYDRNWNQIDVELKFPQGGRVDKPPQFEEMVNIAEELGEGFDHIRVDLYAPTDDQIYFGEMTAAEGSGKNPFRPQEFDFKFGKYW